MEGDFKVGDWLVRPKVGTITKGDHEVSLEPKEAGWPFGASEDPDDPEVV